MSTQDNRHARPSSTPNSAARGGVDPQQPIVRTSPTDRPAAALSPDETRLLASPQERSSRRSNVDQPNFAASPNIRSADRSDVPEQQSQWPVATNGSGALLLWDPVLQTLAAGLDDVEATRIAQANRYRILTTTKPDDDGVVRGFGLAENHPAVVALDAQLKTLEFLDKQMIRALEKQLKAHPLHPWIAAQKGLGAKTVARLLAAIRDPYWNDLHDRPRAVGELFRFCGVAGPDQQLRRGREVHHSPEAKKRIHVIALGMVKNRDSAYRLTYDAGREKYADKVHTAPCAQCGAKGQPAGVGSEWRDGHKHMAALRLVKREILRGLWTEARRIYGADEPSAVAS